MQNNYHLRYFSNFQRFAPVRDHSSLFCNIGAFVFYAGFGPIEIQSTITEKMTAIHFPSNALRSKIFEKVNGCLLKDRHKTGGRFVYSVKISYHQVILCDLYSVIFN